LKRVLFGLALLSLSACEPAGMRLSSEADYGAIAEPAPVMMSDGFAAEKRAAAPSSPQVSETSTAQSYLAYRYNYGFELPSKAVAATAKSHADMCQAAGANKCQILSSSTNDNNADYVSANLALRAEPEWLESFIGDIQNSVTNAEGRMTSNSVSAEDLTRSILDTDARLKAQTTLRDRLQGLLATRNAELSDLLALERELARVQGQIESATTNLAALRQRVSMSRVDINYQSKRLAVSQSAFTPVTNSLKGFVRKLSYGLSNVIDFFAGILPWLLLVILPGLWLLRWFWRRRKPKVNSKV
jgi:hypothetical protein